MDEPTLGVTFRAIREEGRYTRFADAWGHPAEKAESAAALMRFFLCHVLRERVHFEAALVWRPRCEVLLREARERNCLYFKCYCNFESVILLFNNGSDMQYSHSISFGRFKYKYGVGAHLYEMNSEVERLFLGQRGIQSMPYGIPRSRNKLVGHGKRQND